MIVIVLAVRMQLVHLVTLLLIVTMARARYSHQQARQAAVESVPKLVAIIYTGYLHRLSTKYLQNIYTISTQYLHVQVSVLCPTHDPRHHWLLL